MLAQSRAHPQSRHIVAVCGHDVAYLALPVGCDGRWHRVLTRGALAPSSSLCHPTKLPTPIQHRLPLHYDVL
jgi:hypothetical protein